MTTPERPDNSAEPPSSLSQLGSDIVTLVRHELELAKSELSEKIRSASIGAGMLSASAVTALLTLGSLTILLMLILTLVIPLWAAALVVTLLWGAITVALAFLGKRKVEDAAPFVPEQTIENVKEDMAWARRRAKQSQP